MTIKDVERKKVVWQVNTAVESPSWQINGSLSNPDVYTLNSINDIFESTTSGNTKDLEASVLYIRSHVSLVLILDLMDPNWIYDASK